jgi:hypothetical protein
MDTVKNLSEHSIEVFRALSTTWHDFLGVHSSATWPGAVRLNALPPPQVMNPINSQQESQQQQQQQQTLPRRRTREISVGEESYSSHTRQCTLSAAPGWDRAIRAGMQQLLGVEEPEFRSIEQEQALKAILEEDTPLVVILPTGGGKSLLFGVPACIETGSVTAVIVPYRALINNMLEQFTKAGVDCMEWTPTTTGRAALMFVSADQAGDVQQHGNFLSYAQRLKQKGLLRRIVIDECHVTYSDSDWRVELARLVNLRVVAYSMVLLTATLPPSREHDLETFMHLGSGVRYIRASTLQLNTRYYVHLTWCRRLW